MIRTTVGHRVRSVGQFRRNEETPLAAYLHAFKALIEPRKGTAPAHPAHSLRELVRLRIAELGFAIVAHYRLVVLVHQRRTMVIG